MDLSQRKHYLLISHDIVGPLMAGPGIRYYQLARVLSRHLNTVLAVPEGSSNAIDHDGFQIVYYRTDEWRTLKPYAEASRVCIFPSDLAAVFPEIGSSGACLVVDGYDPLLAEWLALPGSSDAGELNAQWQHRMTSVSRQYQLGDFFLCSSERQRDWWLGQLEVSGRINPATYRADPSLRNLVDVVAYGMPDTPPTHTRAVVKGQWQGIGPQDKLLLWGGGLWPWLDPITAIHAVGRVYAQRQDVRLIFPGAKHPNPKMAAMPTGLNEARRVAQELGLLDKAVFFGDWVAYQDWANLLLESDVALTLQFNTLETRLAFRSRVMEYIWAGLPMVATHGDATSDLVERYDLGVFVDYGDADEVSTAICRLLDEPRSARSARFLAAQEALTWEKAAAPLLDYCRRPRRAADKIDDLTGDPIGDLGGDARNFYPNPWDQLRHERIYWTNLIDAYENGRFMRAMNWINRQKQNVRPAPNDLTEITGRGEPVTHLNPNSRYYAHLSIYRFATDYCRDRAVLDAGSGAGYGAYYLAQNGSRSVYGIDISDKAVQFSRDHFHAPNLSYEHMDVDMIAALAAHSFDVIFTSNMLEHLAHVARFLRGACSILASDGQLIAAVPAITQEAIRRWSLEHPYHRNIWSPAQWHHALSLYFAEVSCVRHDFEKPGVALDFGDTPQTTLLNETDFLFQPISPAELSRQGALTALFLARHPRLDAPTGDDLPMIDDSITRPPPVLRNWRTRLRRPFG